MIKVMSLMKRKDGMDFGEFRKWLLDEHVAFARKLPGLRKYTANALITENRDAPYDGITELFFDSEQAMADAFATDAGVPAAPDGLTYDFMGDEHGALIGAATPRLAERIALVPPHCDPTVNLYDRYWIVEGDQVTDSWPVTARGCSR